MDTQSTFVTLDEAVKALKAEELIALPTETVYGLAANIKSEKALQQIFQLKERPLYDPLIVHISSQDMLDDLVINKEKHPALLQLAEHFWPGPLTLVFPRNPDAVSDLITSGLDTVAVRMPEHPLALEVIAKLEQPVAAPSANPFKKTSPTTAELVKQYFPNLKVLDGGPCQVGIESTIVRQRDEHTVEILRPGMITADMMKALPEWKFEVSSNFDLQGPGSMKEHYQPQKPLLLIQSSDSDLSDQDKVRTLQKNLEISFLQKYNLNERLHTLKMNEIILNEDPLLCARYIYKQLFDTSENSDLMYIFWDKNRKNTEAWQSILNRLEKASSKSIML